MSCSQVARKTNEPLIGTAPNYQYYICIEDSQPLWKRGISGSSLKKNHYTRYEHLDVFFSQLNSQCKNFVRPLLIDQDRQSDGKYIFIYTLSNGSYRCHAYEINSLNTIPALFIYHIFYQSDAPQEIKDLWKKFANKLSTNEYNPIEDMTPRIFVCNHNFYDRCCSRGKKVADNFLHHGMDAWRCSHIGGHRFAATMLSMPDGRYYGKIETEDVAKLMKCIYTNRPFVQGNKYRGLGTVTKKLQFAEYLAWTHNKKEDDIQKVWVKEDKDYIYLKRCYSSGNVEYFSLLVGEEQSNEKRYTSCSQEGKPEKQKPWKYFTIKEFREITS